jgi:hypothetical protein
MHAEADQWNLKAKESLTSPLMRRADAVHTTPLWRHAPNDYEYTNQLRGVASHELFGFF